jgi:Mlc titration factor MtfA (ptsG expression regulator)
MREHWWQSLPTPFKPAPIADALWRRAVANCPLARRLSPEQQRDLLRLATLFLARKRFHALAGVALDDYWRLLIAMQACIPLLRQGPKGLRGWRGVLVYPGEFKVRRHHHDGRSEAVPPVEEMRTGEAWERGPLVLSLADVQLDLEQPWDGYNVVVHEMAHKLAMLDGQANGVPPLTDIPRQRWIEQFQLAYERFVQPASRPQTQPVDRHAATSPAEYFAVVSELHFSQPDLLRDTEPAIADLLDAYYGYSPAMRLDTIDAQSTR